MLCSLKLVLNTRTRPVWTVAGVWNRAFVFSRPVELVSWGLLALSHQIHTLTENLIFSLCQTVSWPSHLSSGSWLAAFRFIEKEAFWIFFFKDLVVTPPPPSTFATIYKNYRWQQVCAIICMWYSAGRPWFRNYISYWFLIAHAIRVGHRRSSVHRHVLYYKLISIWNGINLLFVFHLGRPEHLCTRVP